MLPIFSRGPILPGLALAGASMLCQPANAASATEVQLWQQQVFAAERAFASSMAQRNLAQFASLLSEEAVFFGGAGQVLRGKAAVMAGWKAYFDTAQAPFSWEPEVVEVLASGTLAHSSGPVKNPQGQVIMHFNSIWRQETPGVWRVVFDKGSPLPQALEKSQRD